MTYELYFTIAACIAIPGIVIGIIWAVFSSTDSVQFALSLFMGILGPFLAGAVWPLALFILGVIGMKRLAEARGWV